MEVIDPFPMPAPLLVRIAANSEELPSIALCPDFEKARWRYSQLARHILDWLPEVALRPAERRAMLYEPFKQLAHSCSRFFDTDDPEKRGEIGEVLLHLACRQEFDSTPFVTRFYFKMRSNDSVTGVDLAHVVEDRDSGELELWLGEAKLYSNLSDAKTAALRSVRAILDADGHSEMKAMIGPKIEPTHHLFEKVQWLFRDEVSLDKITERLVVPICIAVDFDPTQKASTRDSGYVAKVEATLVDLHSYFKDRLPAGTRFACIFIPLDNKSDLENDVNAKVQEFLV